MSDKLKTNNMTAAIVQLVVGIILTVFPGGSLEVLCRLVGCGILVYGIVSLARAVQEKGTGISISIDVVAIIAGIFFLARPSALASIVPFIVGVILIANGIINMNNAVSNRDMLGKKFISSAAGAVLLIILGILIILNPFSAAGVLVRIIGISLIIAAVENLITIMKK